MIQPRQIPSLVLLLGALLPGCQEDAIMVEKVGRLGPGPEVIGDRLYILTSHYDIAFGALAVDLDAGRTDWIQPNAGFEACQGISADADGVYVVCGELLSVLDPGSGHIRWRVELPSAPTTAPLPLGDRLAIRIDSAPGGVRQAGPDHGPAVNNLEEESTLYSPGSNPEAYVWRWMVDIPHAYAWAWMAMDDMTLPPESLPGEDEALPTPTSNGPTLGAPDAFLQGTATPSPTPETPTRVLVLGKEKGLLLTELKGDKNAPMAPFGGAMVWAKGQTLRSLSLQDGTVNWTYPKSPGPVQLHPTESHLLVLQPNILRCLSPEGQLNWVVETLGWITPIVAGKRLLYLQGGHLIARSIGDGALQWEQPAVGVVDRPVVKDGVIALKTVGGTIHLWDLQTGAELLTFEAGARGRIALGGGRIYWVAQDGLYGMNFKEGDDPQALPLPEGVDLTELQGGFALKNGAPHVTDEALILTLPEGQILKITP